MFQTVYEQRAEEESEIHCSEVVLVDKTDDTIPVAEVNQLNKDKTVIIKESLPKVFINFTDNGLGFGFLYKKGGLIITNAHVVAGYSDVIVRN